MPMIVLSKPHTPELLLTRLTLFLQIHGRLIGKTPPAKLSVVVGQLKSLMPDAFEEWSARIHGKDGRLKQWGIIECACNDLRVDLSKGGRKRMQASLMQRGLDPLSVSQRTAQEEAIAKDVGGRKEFVISDEFLSSYEWRQTRMIALKKYGARCQCCGASPATGAVINVDHIKPRKTHPHLALTLDNLQVLCHDCNHGKGNWDTTDWRK